MICIKRRAAAFGIFILFFLTLLTINFFHTESNLEAGSSCPACHFQTSSLSLCPVLPVQLPPLFMIGILSYQDPALILPAVSIGRLSRSPPLS